MARIDRRKMLKTMGSISLASLIPGTGDASTPKQHDKKLKPIETDVLVIGGGTSGVIAAIQAGRAGCSTMLVESGSQLGGTITTGGVAFPGLFHAWGRQVISGIGWELVVETVNQGKGEAARFLGSNRKTALEAPD